MAEEQEIYDCPMETEKVVSMNVLRSRFETDVNKNSPTRPEGPRKPPIAMKPIIVSAGIAQRLSALGGVPVSTYVSKPSSAISANSIPEESDKPPLKSKSKAGTHKQSPVSNPKLAEAGSSTRDSFPPPPEMEDTNSARQNRTSEIFPPPPPEVLADAEVEEEPTAVANYTPVSSPPASKAAPPPRPPKQSKTKASPPEPKEQVAAEENISRKIKPFIAPSGMIPPSKPDFPINVEMPELPELRKKSDSIKRRLPSLPPGKAAQIEIIGDAIVEEEDYQSLDAIERRKSKQQQTQANSVRDDNRFSRIKSMTEEEEQGEGEVYDDVLFEGPPG